MKSIVGSIVLDFDFIYLSLDPPTSIMGRTFVLRKQIRGTSDAECVSCGIIGKSFISVIPDDEEEYIDDD